MGGGKGAYVLQGRNRQAATVKKRQPDGTFKLEIDEDMRQYITMKLIEALPQFPLEEMEREEKRNRDKKS